MHPILTAAESQVSNCLALLRELVECESPSNDAAAVNRFVDLFASRVSDIARVTTRRAAPYGRILICDFHLPGPRRKQSGKLLALGHSDTVWPFGTLRQMPWRERDGRCWGPGIFDMKGGLAYFIAALRILRELDVPVGWPVRLLIVPDEEIGSEASRSTTESLARECSAVLVLEPAAGLDGKLKTARKGVGDYTVTVHGRAAHAGLDFTAGANAILELARQLERISGMTDLKRGVTLSPGVIRGGTRRNVVPDLASADIDLRVWKSKDAEKIARQMGRLKPVDGGCRIAVEGGLNRAPLERSPGVVRLYKLAVTCARDLGLSVPGEIGVGGGSDGNLTAGLGIPTLDGLGAIGEGAHAAHENVVIAAVPGRVALLARLVQALTSSQPATP